MKSFRPYQDQDNNDPALLNGVPARNFGEDRLLYAHFVEGDMVGIFRA